MAQLWYDSDEVREFHPLVEDSLKTILAAHNLENKFEVKHHPQVPGSTKIPDFALYDKASRRVVFILEVKRTVRDVDSQRHWNQTRGYVRDLATHWDPHHRSRYFAVTNIEKTIAFADRVTGSDANCVLAGNPLDAGRFDPDTHDATAVVESFKREITSLILAAVENTQPRWADSWNPIISSFNSNLTSSVYKLNEMNNDLTLSKEMGTYELLRALLYHFLSNFYIYNKSANARYFRGNQVTNDYSNLFRELNNNYKRALDLDFKQIFSDSPFDETRVTSEQFGSISQYFGSFIDTMQEYMSLAIGQNSSPTYFFNLLTDNLYEHEELHKEGKIMSDSELASLLAEVCINNENDYVLDPGCGDGALLDATYDRILRLKYEDGQSPSHQELLAKVSGIEADPFLTQLAAFRLLMKNANEVDENTEADIVTADIFKTQRPSRYDVILMNPPFLRNEEIVNERTRANPEEMKRAIVSVNEPSFVRHARQPNLYFYFVNYITHYLKDGGTAGVIIMSKFMNNKDSVHLKDYLHDKIEAVVSYPKNYFGQFRVTTSIIILKKQSTSPNVKFLNIKNDRLLSNPSDVRTILGSLSTEVTSEYSIRVVPRGDLDPESNWRNYMLDPEGLYDEIDGTDAFINLSSLFSSFKRGGAGNTGGSDLVFPKGNNDIKLLDKIPENLLCYGMKVNRGKRNPILTELDLKQNIALSFPNSYFESSSTGYDPSLKNEYIESLYVAAKNKYKTAWKEILNAAYNSRVKPQILLPRGERNKHSIFYSASSKPVVISTNFFSLSGYNNASSEISEEEQLKFITAFLISSFGQIQFELLGNDQEGMRKMEGFMLKKLKVLNSAKLSKAEVRNVIHEFEQLNEANPDFSGLEGVTDNPRHGLDLEVSRILVSVEGISFDDPQKLTDYVQLFLLDLVEARTN